MSDTNPPTEPRDAPVLTERDLARRWRKSIRTLQRLRGAADGPVFLRIGGRIHYLLTDIQAFERASRSRGGPS